MIVAGFPERLRRVAVMMLMHKIVVLPKSEDTSIQSSEGARSEKSKMGLVQQMREYEVKKISATGRPIYTAKHDHTLTAYMLALLGFTLKHTNFGAQNTISDVRDLSVEILMVLPDTYVFYI